MSRDQDWILILGGSSGIGLATAQKMASEGFNLLIVHRDRGAAKSVALKAFEELRALKVQVVSLNGNVMNPELEEKLMSAIKEYNAMGRIRLMLHSIAMGNLGKLVDDSDKALSTDDFKSTIEAMALSFLQYGRRLLQAGAFCDQASIVGLTSEGSSKVSVDYAAVGAAKSTLENLCRYMAVEFMPLGVNVNIVNSGVIDTAAISLMEGRASMLKDRQQKNPAGRLTQTQDIANVIYLFTLSESRWINGSIIRADGGEQLS